MNSDPSPSEAIDEMLAGLGGWRGEKLSRVRELIKRGAPDAVEELKWKKPTNPDGVPVWSDSGMVCTGEVYKNHVKVTFARGAALDDPGGLFNASLDGNARRAVDIHEGDHLDEDAFVALVRAAVQLNRGGGAGRRRSEARGC